MELRVSSRRPRMSHESYPGDKELSDDDDDRNHKHRRREDTRSRLLEDEVTGHLYTKSYRRGSKSFQNGQNETWKRYNFNPLDKEISGKFSQIEFLFSRGFSDLNQKSRSNQSLSGHPGAVRGLTTVSNSQGQSWSPFRLVPGIQNGGLDMFHPVGLQGACRPSINSSLNMGLARQRCRDFEEQGFCLRGDMCPMEHGTNRIVVEDVQSLSQFNLPIAPVGTGPTPATSVVTNALSNKGPHGKSIKPGVGDIDSAADFYDPDQPLWSNDLHTSTGLQYLSPPNVGKTNSLLDHGLSCDHLVGQSDGYDDELVTSSKAVTSLKTRSFVQGRIARKNGIFKATPSNFLQNETISNRTRSGNGRMSPKPSQKAQRTLYINGIPHQNNKRELLLSHFQKFGKVIDISIPINSERAFVQFSKREEAEAALMAPDAVMGNRFIKLFWANRDVIHDNQTVSAHGLKVSSVSNKVSHNNKGSHAPVSAFDHPNPMVVEGNKVNPPLQKKLELLKEELRKKQEMLDQKRNDFRHKLAKLEKQATSPKGEVASEQLAKKQKLVSLANSVMAASPSGLDAIVPSLQDEVAGTSSKVGPSGKQSFKTNLALVLPESSSLKSSSLSLVNLGSPVGNSRFKLDNRPTAFKVVPPLPDGLASVSVLKEHFAPYGDLSKVQVDDIDSKTSNVTAHIYFRTRHAAEKAFLGGKSWKSHSLQFVWLNSTNSRKDDVAKAEPYETHQSNCISVAESIL